MQGLRSRAFMAQRSAPVSRTALNVVAKESRIGMKAVPIPKGVTIDLKGQELRVKVRAMAQSNADRWQQHQLAAAVQQGAWPGGGFCSHMLLHGEAACGAGAAPETELLLQGPKGELQWTFVPEVTLAQVRCSAARSRRSRSGGRRRA